MFNLNTIYNESCLDTIDSMVRDGIKVNIVLTSPPYNTSHNDKGDLYHHRYGEYNDIISNDEYIDKTVNLFNKLDKVLGKNGVILYNLSYSARNPSTYLRVLNAIIERTDFDVYDTIIWKKHNAIPDNASPNRLTRIVEYIYVIARKCEARSFQCNKGIQYKGKMGHVVYNSIFNMVEAKNNDGSTKLNKATFSSELCEKLLSIYSLPNNIVYDPFIGTGTTAVACKKLGLYYIGSEIDSKQVEYSIKRIDETES